MVSVLGVVGSVVEWIWSWPMMIMLPGVAILFTVLLRGLQFRQLCPALRSALFSRESESSAESDGDMSNFQALMTALASCVGAGNVVGVASAIAQGGPGAVFWMWIVGLISMATKYAEAVLGVKYRVQDANGNMLGGPMQYLPQAFPGPLGVRLGMMYALFTMGASFDMVQPNSVAKSLDTTLGVPPWVTAIVLTFLAGSVIIGGVRSISRAAEVMVPFMIIAYLGCGLVVVALNIEAVPRTVWFIMKDAFTTTAARGAFTGASVQAAVRYGLSRAVFSNEAGLGIGGIAAAAARTPHPVQQALVSMTQVFIDTLLVCSITAFCILSSDAWTLPDPGSEKVPKEALTGAPLTIEAFNTGMPGHALGGYIVTISLAFFVFTSIIGWYYFGERAAAHAFGTGGIKFYRFLHLSVVFTGAILAGVSGFSGFDLAWIVVDFMNSGIATANVLGLLALAPVVLSETRHYFGGQVDENWGRDVVLPEEGDGADRDEGDYKLLQDARANAL